MKRALTMVLIVTALTVVPGCGDPINRMLSAGEQRHELMHRIAANTDAATEVLEVLLEAEESRTLVLDRVLASSDARQELLARVATDPTLLDGAINFAAQDSVSRARLMTLVKGMSMGGGR